MNIDMDKFEEGIKFFNEGNYFEAHETWEDQWRGIENSPEKYFIQGLIMVAVALHHYKRKNYIGTSRLLEKGIKLLKKLEGIKIKIDLDDFLKEIVTFQGKVKSSQKCISDKELPRIKRL
ncbi:MAG: DUF309 domain-containing protein [Candidatus Brocadia sp. AMX2]|uniref:Uncharacterized conserved protein n=1 Tax=Candidatus Brocadia sinica JPN1 TaxID=1197129 RepID=A0ABQ0K233_9BACT|nr:MULTISPECIES: DUF309 domain-containing protein [Brocadia]KXK33287.1 MAG: hypothetical protein UZ01_00094 [Candidatus Brocadia sinica]MBC6931565.1 DUF309 domain-containing protein [Candidatus Brocadia sp.]MBL1169206.1 DUF309 domain-containing protein [Candidatus Brocadia sp. AMX1]NOG42938.1 DUF309 domain-containing protein [Planctomycetota bacterium]KAA0242488.1 MAG: DUF309 domain-containing protein [Candidatus Brocadia sp. AMX2]